MCACCSEMLLDGSINLTQSKPLARSYQDVYAQSFP